MKKFITLLLLVGISLLGVSYDAQAGNTNFGGIQIDGNSDPSNTSSSTLFSVRNTSGTEILSITAGAVLSFATGSVTFLTATATTATIATLTVTSLVSVTDSLSPSHLHHYVRIRPQYLELYTCSATMRPASGAQPGATIAITTANSLADCSAAGGGSVFVVCTSDGTNWRPLGSR